MSGHRTHVPVKGFLKRINLAALKYLSAIGQNASRDHNKNIPQPILGRFPCFHKMTPSLSFRKTQVASMR